MAITSTLCSGRYAISVRQTHQLTRLSFDFLMYHFEFSSNPPTKIVYFVPEFEIPDEFYTTLALEADFTIPQFQQYRVVVDENKRWIAEIKRIIEASPNPRKPGARPSRPLILPSDKSQNSKGTAYAVKTSSNPGRKEHKEAMLHGHRQFFYSLLDECVRR